MSQNELLDELNALVDSHHHLSVESDGQVFFGSEDSRQRHTRALARAEVQLLAHQLNHLSEGLPGGGIIECTYRGVRWTLLSQPLSPSWSMMACRARREHVELHVLTQHFNLEPTLVAALHDAFASRANILCSSPMRTKLLPFFDALLLFPQPGQLAFVLGDVQALDFERIAVHAMDRKQALAHQGPARDILLRWIERATWVFCDRIDSAALLDTCFAGSPFAQGRVLLIEANTPNQAVERIAALGEDGHCQPLIQRVLHIEGNRITLHALRDHGLELIAESRIGNPGSTPTHAPQHQPMRTPSREIPAAHTPSGEFAAYRRPEPESPPQPRRASSSSGVRAIPQQHTAEPQPRHPATGSFKRPRTGLLRRSGEFSPIAQQVPNDPLAEVEADFSISEPSFDDALQNAVDAAFDDDNDEITFAEESIESTPGGENAGGFFFDDEELAELEEAARSASSPQPAPSQARRSSRYDVPAVRNDPGAAASRGRYQPRPDSAPSTPRAQAPTNRAPSNPNNPRPARPSGSFRTAQPGTGRCRPPPGRTPRPRIGRNAATKGGNTPGAIPAHLQEGTLSDDVRGDILDEPTRRAQVPRPKPKTNS